MPGDQYPETNDNDENAGKYGRNDNIHACSYLYEFNAAKCSWYNGPSADFPNAATDLDGNGEFSWQEVKKTQLALGDGWHQGPYSESQFPIVRCFHHALERTVKTVDPTTGDELTPQGVTLNVAYGGNVYEGPLQWEYTK